MRQGGAVKTEEQCFTIMDGIQSNPGVILFLSLLITSFTSSSDMVLILIMSLFVVIQTVFFPSVTEAINIPMQTSCCNDKLSTSVYSYISKFSETFKFSSGVCFFFVASHLMTSHHQIQMQYRVFIKVKFELLKTFEYCLLSGFLLSFISYTDGLY